MTTGTAMPTSKAEIKTGRSDRTVFAERRNRLEKARSEFRMKLLEKEKSRARFVIGKERKEIAKNFQNVTRTTGQSHEGIPSSLLDKDVCSSEHYRRGLKISNRRLKQWRRQEEVLQKLVAKEEVEDEEELSDRQLVLNNLLAELRHEVEGPDEMRQVKSRPVKELRMPYSAHPSTLDVFESLRAEVPNVTIESDRPATAPVARVRHRGENVIMAPVFEKTKCNFDIPKWEKVVTRQYIDLSPASSLTNLTPNGVGVSTTVKGQTLARPQSGQREISGTEDTPLFVRVNSHLTGEQGKFKIRPHSASGISIRPKRNERPKSSPGKAKSALKSNITNNLSSATLTPLIQSNTASLTPSLTSSKSGVSFDLRTTVHQFETDDLKDADEDLADSMAATPNSEEMNIAINGDQVDSEKAEDPNGAVDKVQQDTTEIDSLVKDPDQVEERPGTAESSSSRKTSTSSIRKVSFHDQYRPGRSLPRGLPGERSRKVSSSSTGSGYNSSKESIDILRNKQLLINLDSRGTINKRLTNANGADIDEAEEEKRPSGPAQWRRELLRDAPPGVHSQAEKPRVFMTMSRSARKKELEKMVEENTFNLRDMIISEKERRAQTRINMQRSMAELDTIKVPS